jgi:predicted lysophospholipase L1 biosynthesis ABC-type transport system permease subunit
MEQYLLYIAVAALIIAVVAVHIKVRSENRPWEDLDL